MALVISGSVLIVSGLTLTWYGRYTDRDWVFFLGAASVGFGILCFALPPLLDATPNGAICP